MTAGAAQLRRSSSSETNSSTLGALAVSLRRTSRNAPDIPTQVCI
jgi:hypothetical protein